MKRLAVFGALVLILGGCAAAKPVTPFMQERNIFSQEKPVKQKKSAKVAKDPATDALAKLSVFLKTDPYKVPARILLGNNVYEETLAVVTEDKEKYDADTVRFARGISLFRLHRYAEASKELTGVGAESSFAKMTETYYEAASAFAKVEKVIPKPATSQEELNTLHLALHAERKEWYTLSKNSRFDESVRAVALEEVERIDRMIFGLVAEYEPSRSEEALGFLVTWHHESKNFLRHKLSAVYLLLWKIEYLEAQHSPANDEMIARTTETAEKTLKEVMNEDGTVEKLEARRLLEVLTIRKKTAEGVYDASKK